MKQVIVHGDYSTMLEEEKQQRSALRVAGLLHTQEERQAELDTYLAINQLEAAKAQVAWCALLHRRTVDRAAIRSSVGVVEEPMNIEGSAFHVRSLRQVYRCI